MIFITRCRASARYLPTGGWLFGAVCGAGALVLGWPPVTLAWQATARPTAAVQVVAVTDQQLSDLERQGRSRPDRALRQAQAWMNQPDLPPDLQLELLRQMVQFRIDLEQGEAIQHLIAQIRGLPLPPGEPALQAEVLAHCLEADRVLRGGAGALRPLESTLRDWLAKMPAQMPAVQRMGCWRSAAAVAERLGHFDDAVRRGQTAQRIAEEVDDWRTPLLMARLAYTLHRAGQLEASQKLMQEAGLRARRHPDPSVLFELQTLRAVMLPEGSSDAETLKSLQDALDLARAANAPRDEALAQANLSDYHLQRGEWQLACDGLQRVRLLTRELPHTLAEDLAELNCGLALILDRRLAQGLALVQRQLDNYRRVDDLASLTEGLRELGQTLEKAGFLEAALLRYREERSLARERFRRDQQAALLEAREAFEAERRERERAMLEGENQLKAEALHQSELRWRERALGSAALAVILLGLGLWYARLRSQQALLQEQQGQLRRATEHDALTGLANRHHLKRVLQLGAGAAELPVRGTLFLLDLDHFKAINDFHGHAAGDAVLVEVARRLRAVLRAKDLIARWGGEEFLVLTGPGSMESADALSQRLLAAMALMPVMVGGATIPITVSMGYATFPLAPGPVTVPWDPALELVDAAMYLAKELGRNSACGVRQLPAQTAEDVLAVARRLPAAWHAGEVAVCHFRGPSRGSRPVRRAPAGVTPASRRGPP